LKEVEVAETVYHAARYIEVLADKCIGCGACFKASRVEDDKCVNNYSKCYNCGVRTSFYKNDAFTVHCDCEDFSASQMFPNVGILAAKDPMAIDRASVDLIDRSPPIPWSSANTPEVHKARDRSKTLTGAEGRHQLRGGRETQNRNYELQTD
jgi:uncharacterized Fe-S center protein